MRPEWLARIDALFEDAGIPYAFSGRTAAWLWGAGRPGTQAVEVLARLLPGDGDDLLAAARANHLGADPGLAGRAAEAGEGLTLLLEGDAYADVAPARGEADLEALAARVELPRPSGLPGMVPVLGLEECIARLLARGQAEDRAEDQAGDLGAARRLAERHRDRLDQDLLGRRCEELGVLALLHQMRGEPAAYTSA